MVSYDIYLNNARKIIEWIQQQPNLININPDNVDNKIICEFNHTAQEEIEFKREILKRLFQIDIGNNTFEDLLDKLEQIQTDQLIYSSQVPITLTNIGITYKNLYTDFGGRPFFIDTTGFKSLAIQILWTKIGTGVQQMRIINDSDNDQILESPSLTTQSNEFTDVVIPNNYLNFKGKWRLQVKSTVAGDDPVFSAIYIYLRR